MVNIAKDRFKESVVGEVSKGADPSLSVADGDSDSDEDEAGPVMDGSTTPIEGGVLHPFRDLMEGFKG